MEDNTRKSNSFACVNCSAELTYDPGTTQLTCNYCGTENEILVADGQVEELDYHAFFDSESSKSETITVTTVLCDSCGANSTLDNNVQSSFCPYCAFPLIIENATDQKVMKPRSLLPFKFKENEAKEAFKKWIKRLWFAPGKLKKVSLSYDHFKAIYIPYWTFDSKTKSAYVGARGKHYTVTEKRGSKTITVKKTSWTTVKGTINKDFDDVLTVASHSLPQSLAQELEPWDLENLVPFDSKYLSGFTTEKYQVGLDEGFSDAKVIMTDEIKRLAKKEIGGDVQRISSVRTAHDKIQFKHILLPVYVSTYRFKEKIFRCLVNARTGEVQGERPFSWQKIVGTVILAIATLFLIAYLINAIFTTDDPNYTSTGYTPPEVVNEPFSKTPLLKASLKDNVLSFEDNQVESRRIIKLKEAFLSNTPLSTSMIRTLYSNNFVKYINLWYELEDDFKYKTYEDFKIIPVEVKEFEQYSVFIFKRSPDLGESFEGDALSFRYLSNNRWVREIFVPIGTSVQSQLDCEYEWRNGELQIVSISKLRSPGLLYYINQQIDIPLSSEQVRSVSKIYKWSESDVVLSSSIVSDTVIFHPDDGFKEQLEKDGNGDVYIETLLKNVDISYEMKHQLIDGIIYLQNAILEEPIQNQIFLKIIGSDIWVRNNPSDGEVVMKLNNGDLCLVLQKGKYEEIRDMKGYWYQIDFQGSQGWVYGHQTTLKLKTSM